MTVQNTIVKNVYVGNGSTTVFPFTFECNKAEHIQAFVKDAVGNISSTTNFKVNLDQKNVTYPNTGEPLPDGYKLIILRQLPLQQLLNLLNQGPFYAEDIEETFDEVVMMLQQMTERIGRSLAVSIDIDAENSFNTIIPLEAGKTFRVKDDGTGFEVTEDPGKVIDGAKALLKQTTQQAEFAKEQADASSQSAVSAQNAANAAEAVAPEYAKTKEVLDNIVSYTNTATEQASIATAKANAANVSATNAAQSYANADAVATQLTEYLATKETLTAPAVDKTLLIEGAAADSKVVGELNSDLNYVKNIIFTWSYPSVNVSDIPNIEKYEGYNATPKTNGVEVLKLTNYDSYVIVADHNCDIYVEETIPSSEYYAITIGKNYTGKNEYSSGEFMLLSSDSIRYRNTENNLPTVSNKLTVNKGDVIVFTFLKDKGFTLNGYIKVKTPIINFAGYASKTATSLIVTIGKLRVVLNKYNDSSIRAFNLWRANNAYIKASNGEFTRLWYNSDSDGVVKIKDEDDFIGGYHGDETQTAFRLFIDGIEYSEGSAFTDLYFNELVIYCKSEIYHCNTSGTPDVMAFKRNKIITFNKDGYSVSNYWVAQEDLTITKAYMGMLSIERYTDNNYTDYLINGYHTNNDFDFVDADTGTSANKDITEVVFNTIHGDVGIKISDIKTIDDYSYYGNITNYNSDYDKRLKVYLANIDSNSGKSISVGTVIKANVITFIR